VTDTKKWVRAACWILPPLALLVIHRYALTTWFLQDDFAWLSQGRDARTWQDWLGVIFVPMAQGTIRPWSERLYFILLRSLFGIDPLPFHVWAFLTQVANLTLLQSIVRRATGSTVAGVAAALFWAANSGLATPLGWASAYNQLLCSLFLLGSLRLLQQYLATGERRWWIAQWVTFILGFGALEIAVVYPALAGAYCWLHDRPRTRKTLPMWLVSIAYVALHRSLAPKITAGPYAQHWDLSMLATLKSHIQIALGGGLTHHRLHLPEDAWQWAGGGVAAAMGLYLAWRAWRRDFQPWFGLVWFLVAIGPVLPLRDHVMDYYIATASFGLAWIAGCAVRDALRSGWSVRAATAAALVVYVLFSGPAARGTSRWRYDRAREVEMLVEGLRRAAELHPGRTILLTGVTTGLFWTAVFDEPYRLFGKEDVLLLPGAEKPIEPHPELGDISQFETERALAGRMLAFDRAVVYQVEPDRLRNDTGLYRGEAEKWRKEFPSRVDAGNPIFADLLGPTWYEPEETHRWMPGEATVRIAGPRRAGQKLWLQGYCPEGLTAGGPVRLDVLVENVEVGNVEISNGRNNFELLAPLSLDLVGKQYITVKVKINRTFRPPPEGRELGLSFGVFWVR